MVRRRITTYAELTSEHQMQIEAEIQARRAARISADLLPDSTKTKEEEEQPEEEVPEAMEEDDPEIHAPSLNMAKAEAEFVVAQADEMAEQQATLDSMEDEAVVEANRGLIRYRGTRRPTPSKTSSRRTWR
ncbi:putative laccase-11 [Hordeum vulgare]|nr:putative laccase-11 [Hordeum vulgare]